MSEPPLLLSVRQAGPSEIHQTSVRLEAVTALSSSVFSAARHRYETLKDQRENCQNMSGGEIFSFNKPGAVLIVFVIIQL